MMVAGSYTECRVPNVSLIIFVAELSEDIVGDRCDAMRCDAMRCDTIHSIIANRAGSEDYWLRASE